MAAPSPSAEPAAELIRVSCTYGETADGVTALAGVDLVVDRAHMLAIVGPSGSGKSTLVRCLAGLQPVQEGHVLVDGVDLGLLRPDERTVFRRRHLGVVLQHGALHPGFTVRENILLPLTLDHRRADESWVDEIVTRLELTDRLGHRPAELSGGQRSRVAVARALVHRPTLVLADEPTGNLDLISSHELLDVIRTLVDDLAATVVMVTHDLAMALRADRAVVLVDGGVVADLASPSWDELATAVERADGAGLA